MNNVCFEVKKSVGNAFSSDPLAALLTQQTVKNSIFGEKNGCREKCLDKSLLIENDVIFFF